MNLAVKKVCGSAPGRWAVSLPPTHRAMVYAMALGFGCLSVGCDSNPVGDVSGQVTLNGTPLTSGRVMASHQSGSTVSSEIEENGSFTLARRNEPGLLPGDYRVHIVAYENGGVAEHPEAPLKLLIPEHYTKPDTSGLNFTVAAGETKEITFELKD